MTRFSNSTTATASTTDHPHFNVSDLPKSSMSIRPTIRRGSMRTNWTLASYITFVHGDAISCIDLLHIGPLRYIAIGSYDGVLSLWSMDNPSVVHQKQRFTLQSAPMRAIQVANSAIVVCNVGHIYHLQLDGQLHLWYELARPLIFADIALPSSNLIVVSKSNCIIVIDVSDVLRACSSDVGEQSKELARKQVKEITIPDIVDGVQPHFRTCGVGLDGINEHVTQAIESTDFHPITCGNTINNNLDDSETENEDVCARTAYIACACLISPNYVAFVCSHGFFCLYNLLLEEVVFKFQLGRNAIATYMTTTYMNSVAEPLTTHAMYIVTADGSLTVWKVAPEKKELQLIAVRSNYGSAISCIALLAQKFVVLGLSNGKIKIYEVENINHSVGVCKVTPDDQHYQTAGVSCILWLDQDTLITGTWDRGVFIYTHPHE